MVTPNSFLAGLGQRPAPSPLYDQGLNYDWFGPVREPPLSFIGIGLGKDM